MRTSILNNKYVSAIICTAFWLFIWQGLYLIVGHDVLLPPPLSVLKSLMALFFNLQFWSALCTSLFKVALGLLGAIISAVFLSLLCSVLKIADVIITPAMSITRAMPVAGVIIVMLVFIAPKHISIFICFLMVMPIVFESIDAGKKSVDTELLQMAQVFDITGFKLFRSIYVPSIVPYFVNGVINSIGFSWKASIAGEILAIYPNTLGYYMYNSKITLETANLFAYTLVIIIISTFMEYRFKKLSLKIK